MATNGVPIERALISLRAREWNCFTSTLGCFRCSPRCLA
ncbi:Uncharacterised protein [Vibrio cholerae]|nr:Uncharacterised protein [Vibrio cholerae]